MTKIVTCVFVSGHVNYTPDYVFKLRNMAARHIPDHCFVCLTDRPHLLPGIETIKIDASKDYYAWWKKLELFNPKHELLQSGRIMYFDLDVLIVKSLEQIETFDAPMALVPDAAPNFTGRGALKVVKQFNSSVMVWDGGACNDLYLKWNPQVTKRLWGDQDWIGEQLPTAAKMPLEWFPRLSQLNADDQSLSFENTPTLVVLCKKPKNELAAKQWKWFREAWQ